MVLTGLLTHGVPNSVNVSAHVGGYRNSAVTALRILHQVALGLECRARIIEARKENRHGLGALAGMGLRTKPDHIGSPVSSDSHLWSSHGTYRHGTRGLAVHANRLGEILPAWRPAHVLNFPGRGIAREVNHVQHAIALKHSLRLNPVIRCS